MPSNHRFPKWYAPLQFVVGIALAVIVGELAPEVLGGMGFAMVIYMWMYFTYRRYRALETPANVRYDKDHDE